MAKSINDTPPVKKRSKPILMDTKDISESKQDAIASKEELNQAIQRLNAHMDNSPLAVIEFDSHFRVIRWSKMAEHMFGWSSQEILGRAISEISWVYQDDVERVDRVSRDFASGKVPYGLNVNRNYRKDGSVIWCEWYSSSIYDSEGRLTSVLSQVLDITERKKAEEELKASEKKYRSLFDNMAEAVLLWEVLPDNLGKRKNYRLLDVNPACEKLVNMPKNKLLDKTFSEIFSINRVILARFEQLLNETLVTGKPTTVEEYDHNLKRWIQGTIFSPASSRVAVIFSDITGRKEAEQFLIESEKENRALIETANSVILRWLPDGTLTFMNDYGLKFFGYTRDEIIGKNIRILLPSGKKPGTLVRNIVDHIDKHEAHINENIRKDGSIAQILWANKAILDDKGKIKEILAIGNDVTVLHNIQKELIKSRDNLELKVQERTSELSQAYEQLKAYGRRITQVQEEERKRVAYELHDDTAQYLGILKMQINALVQSGKIQSPEVLEKLQYLEKDADRAFNDVRRYSHELRPTTLEHQGLVAALEQISDDFNKLGQFSVEVQVEGMEPELSEEVKLGFFRVAQEALNNTRKHAKASQARINLSFNQNQIQMMVIDNGLGFNAKEALRKNSGKGNLGLMSMRERADLINADLKIESEPGTGTKVILKAKI